MTALLPTLRDFLFLCGGALLAVYIPKGYAAIAARVRARLAKPKD